jgi:ubiquinone/menaquinone biosynthesis C-methylase UbiE
VTCQELQARTPPVSPSSDLASIPARIPWSDFRELFRRTVETSLAPWMNSDQTYLQGHLSFALGRFDEGVGFLRYFEVSRVGSRFSHRDLLDLLDVGTGNGGVAFAFANSPNYRVSAIDIGQNQVLRQVVRSTGLPIRYALANGHALPYPAESFDIVLLVDALEHISQPRALGREIIRVLRPGGVCFITTPARMRYLFAADPHYGVHCLAGLPNPLQRFIVNRVARRRIVAPDGRAWPAYDVAHLYWHAQEIARLFPGPNAVEILFAIPPIGGAFLSLEWWRRKLRNFLFNHVIIHKTGASPSSDKAH